MSARKVSVIRWTIAGGYTALGLSMHPEITLAELAVLVLLAPPAIVAILALGWINEAERREP